MFCNIFANALKYNVLKHFRGGYMSKKKALLLQRNRAMLQLFFSVKGLPTTFSTSLKRRTGATLTFFGPE